MTSRSSAPIRAAPRWIWVVAVAAIATGSAAAQPSSSSRADALFAEGNAAITRNDAATAARHYRAAWDLAPEARFALNLGIALAELGQTAGAAEAFTIYLADPACDPAKRPVLEQRLQLWRPDLGEIVLDVTPGSADIEIDGARPLRSAAGTSVPVSPGSHVVTARAAGYRGGELRLSVAARARVVAQLALVAPSARSGDGRAEIHEQNPPASARPWMWIALGAGVAAAAAGGYFGLVAIDRWGEVDTRCPDGTCTRADDLALAADARRAGTRSNIAFVASGAALIGALVLWRVGPHRRSRPGVAFAPHNSGGMLWLSGSL